MKSNPIVNGKLTTNTCTAMRLITIPKYISIHNVSKEVIIRNVPDIKKGLKRLHSSNPDISIIIPAYNESDNILKTLSSLSHLTTSHSVEVIVVDNNSDDNTAELAKVCGSVCIRETEKGVTAARNAGLNFAKGRFVLNADADTLYPPRWADLMIAPLNREEIAMVYGSFAFIPTRGTPRITYFGYEYLSDLVKWKNKTFKEEAVNIYGFNSSFRRLEGVHVDGFNHPPGTNEDGWLGVKLRDGFSKKLFHMNSLEGMVWTTDRRIQMDGGLIKGIWKRITREIGR